MLDFYNTDVFRQITTECYMAAQNEKPFDISGFPAAEYRYFGRLYALYSEFAQGKISRTEAAAKRQQYYKQYQNDREIIVKCSGTRHKYRELEASAQKLCDELTKMTAPLPPEVSAAYAKLLVVIRSEKGTEENT